VKTQISSRTLGELREVIARKFRLSQDDVVLNYRDETGSELSILDDDGTSLLPPCFALHGAASFVFSEGSNVLC